LIVGGPVDGGIPFGGGGGGATVMSFETFIICPSQMSDANEAVSAGGTRVVS
jgi:hypothetical protein